MWVTGKLNIQNLKFESSQFCLQGPKGYFNYPLHKMCLGGFVKMNWRKAL